ncbi:hypothetical protein [Pseudomonas sp. NCCP-436]|uniref:hypothetical protein n=1 Tax=Pseudomonas sp. NCCP-436 TaxID=2842481 RepID=UPI001C7EB69C|nr:hypothetical protein [Pseudomonas sp. NCCP-436]GIZ12333.1 hypothetical protein NCCP436_17490 [Pseudomonas sp. NCCP-436]
MSLQVLWSLVVVRPAGALNALALFFALAGAWLWLMTRLREQRGQARVLAQGQLEELGEESGADERAQRINRFFYRFGGCCLGMALILSWGSTHL